MEARGYKQRDQRSGLVIVLLYGDPRSPCQILVLYLPSASSFVDAMSHETRLFAAAFLRRPTKPSFPASRSSIARVQELQSVIVCLGVARRGAAHEAVWLDGWQQAKLAEAAATPDQGESNMARARVGGGAGSSRAQGAGNLRFTSDESLGCTTEWWRQGHGLRPRSLSLKVGWQGAVGYSMITPWPMAYQWVMGQTKTESMHLIQCCALALLA